MFELWSCYGFEDGSWQAWYVRSKLIAEVVHVLAYTGKFSFEDVVPGSNSDFVNFVR